MRSLISRRHAISTPRLILSFSLLFVGVSLVMPPPAFPSNLPSQSQTVSSVVEPISPNRIIIPKLGIDLPIASSQIINGYWQISSVTASYGLGSGIVGQKGNAVIFAHARPDQFLPLKAITIGTRIYVTTSQNWFSYTVISRSIVRPNDTKLIAPTTSEMLTLYTCDGFNDSERLVVQAAAAGI